MRVYVTGKVEGMSKEDVKRLVESQGYEFSDFSKSTDLLVYADKAGPAKLSKALEWGVKTISWTEFAASLGITGQAPPPQVKVSTTKKVSVTAPSQMQSKQYASFKAEKRTGPVLHNVLKTAEFVLLNGKGFTKIDLSGISGLNVSRLHLEENALTEIDLSPLQNLGSLRWLVLARNALHDIDLRPLSSCAGLSVLELAWNQLTHIDLSPLASCTNLGTLVLSHNQLKHIDLTPLQNCRRLEHLYLSGIGLSHVDLSPLAACTSLATLYLDANSLADIDLAPICSGRLEDLNLAGNMLTSIDLSGLHVCESLLSLDLSSNQLKIIDIVPLSQLPGFRRFALMNNRLEYIDLTPVAESWSNKYGEGNKVYTSRSTPHGLRETSFDQERGDILLEINDQVMVVLDATYRERIESDGNHAFANLRGRISWLLGPELAKKVFQEEGWAGLKKRLKVLPRKAAFSALSMAELTGLDAPLDDVLSWIPGDTTLDQGLSEVYSKAVSRLRESLENKQSTQNLDVDVMKHTSAAVLVPRILEIRKGELDSTVLLVDCNGRVNLNRLHGTYYGGLLIEELKLGWQTDEEGLKKLRAALNEIGLDIVVEHEHR